MDQITGVRVFVLAVDLGSLAAAGRQLALSSAMTGRYLRSLETQLNARLLQRSTRRLSLTDVGQRYYERCKRILAEFDDANHEAADRNQTLQGTLKVAAPVTFGTMHLGSSVARYLSEHPGVAIDVALSDRHVDLLEAGIDVAIRIGQLHDDTLTVRRLAACRMVACASPSYLEAHGTPAKPMQLRNHVCLAFSGAVSAGDWTFTAPNGIEHTANGPFRMHANNMDMLQSAALAGLGIAYGPSFVFGEALAKGSLTQVLAHYATTSLPIHAVFPTARYIPRMVRTFVDLLVEDFGGVAPWERWSAE
ncbi:LysR family transcriptional regulator [Dyella monticola]|uniref:LysR family transcriptional regulator n=1 Tax=Dyella monticola TaxID=1927958 RepID=A0A370X533_9GAMM|nr:LysR family transcriptional regulator [Dyella monticola]RDS83543.1 LysR family transcriptional regulator [Dyella monticola]